MSLPYPTHEDEHHWDVVLEVDPLEHEEHHHGDDAGEGDRAEAHGDERARGVRAAAQTSE